MRGLTNERGRNAGEKKGYRGKKGINKREEMDDTRNYKRNYLALGI